MIESLYDKIMALASAYRKHCFSALSIVFALACAGLFFVRYDNDVAIMLPSSPLVVRSLAFYRDSSIADNILLSISLKNGKSDTAQLFKAADAISQDLESCKIGQITAGIDNADMMSQVVGYLDFMPELLSASELDQLDERLNEKQIAERIHGVYKQILSPGGGFILPFLQKDPLGIAAKMLQRMQSMATSSGYNVEIEQGYFVNAERTHVLLSIKTPDLLGGVEHAREVLASVEQVLARYASSVNVDVVAPHRHTISNEKVLKEDLKLIITVTALSFFLLFILVFRDYRVLWIFLLPSAAVVIASCFTALIFGKLSYFVVGFGAVVVGVAVDYGIHVYVAMQANKNAVRNIVKPVVINAMTTLSVFVVFLFSSVTGYLQLACFAIVSILLSLGFAIWALPQMLPATAEQSCSKKRRDYRANPKVVLVLWLLLLALCAWVMFPLSINSNIAQFDGSEDYVLDQERRFRETWGNSEESAVLVVEGKTLEDALEVNDGLCAEIYDQLGNNSISSFAAVWHSLKTRTQNLKNWNAFWSPERQSLTTNLITESAAVHGFADGAFDPFFNIMRAADRVPLAGTPGQLGLFEKFMDRFVIHQGESVRVLSFFIDSADNIERIKKISAPHEEAYIVSRRLLSQSISESIASELAKLALIASALILLLISFMFRNVRLALLALVPVVSAVLMSFALFSLLGMEITVFALVAMLMVIGLCIDYGVFIVYAQQHAVASGSFKAVILSALTTVIGSGALIFANHPVMYIIGITLVTGIVTGCVSAILVVPALYRLTNAAPDHINSN